MIYYQLTTGENRYHFATKKEAKEWLRSSEGQEVFAGIPDMAEIYKLDFPTDKKGLIDWLNFYYCEH